MRRIPLWPCFLGVALLLTGALVGLALLISSAAVDGPPTEPARIVEIVPAPPTRPTGIVVKAAPRRLMIAGAEGYAVVLNPDGSGDVVDPAGNLSRLLPPRDPVSPALAEDALVKRVAERIAARLRTRSGPGRLIVLDQGIVDVPVDAVVTYTGLDHLVTLDPDGGATVYYTDGRVVRKDRAAQPDAIPTK